MDRRYIRERVFMDVVMPQMGESVAEGTIVRWIKKVGDKVDRDEPLFEISTDKVDAEIPSPAAGILSEILAKEGDTVPVNSVVAVIGSGAEAAAPRPAPAKAATPAKPPEPAKTTVNAPSAATENISRDRTSPLVRQLAKEHDVDLSQVHGTGIGGRVTKDDVLAFVGRSGQEGQGGREEQDRPHGAGDRVEKMSVMRKTIAEHMVASRRTSAHVHTVFEVDFSRVEKIRQAKKAEFERSGAKLTYLSFILKAAVDALRAMPIVNASLDGDTLVYHNDINVGIAVALERRLI